MMKSMQQIFHFKNFDFDAIEYTEINFPTLHEIS